MSHDKETYSNYKRQSARVAQSEWRLNDKGQIEDMVRQWKTLDGRWVDYHGDDFTWNPERRVIWRPR